MKHLILVVSPPACGKSFITDKLAKALKNCVYLDKDSLQAMSKMIFKVAGQPYERSSQFFEDYVRDVEYEAIMDVAYEALRYNDYVLVNAPFSREVRNPKYMEELRQKLLTKNTKLEVIWVECDIEVSHQRMIARNSERDADKLRDWDAYVAGRDYSRPKIEGLMVVDNSTDTSYKADLERIIDYMKNS